MIVLEVHGWHTACGSCGYGSGGWAGSPALEGKTPLNPRSTVCHGCGEAFTHVREAYKHADPRPIEPSAAA